MKRREALAIIFGGVVCCGADFNTYTKEDFKDINLKNDKSLKPKSFTATKAYLRPPGAILEEEFMARCIKCGQCVQVCPYHCLKLLGITAIFSIGTPHIVANERGCYLCNALPCILACPSGALDHHINEPKKVKMGIAQIKNPTSCLAFNGKKLNKVNIKIAQNTMEESLNLNLSSRDNKECDLCVRFCPYPESQKAIRLIKNDNGLMPEILSECVGCGVCVELCPENVIEILPLD